MEQALEKAVYLGAKVTYDAPLLTINDLTKNYGAPEMGPIISKSLPNLPEFVNRNLQPTKLG